MTPSILDTRVARRLSPWLTTMLLFGGGLDIVLALLVDWRRGDFHDFYIFYESDVAALAGRALYAGPNLNPPIFILLTSPLGWLPLRSAWLLWQLLSLLTFLWALRLAWLPTRHIPAAMVLVLVVVHASTPAQMMFGQVAWLLSLPLVLAWVAFRQQRWSAAGAWLGLVVAMKPFLLPLFVCGFLERSWRRVALVAAVTAVALTLLPLPVFGPAALTAWWTAGQNAWHSTDQPTLASLTGTLYRHGWSAAASVSAAALLWLPLLGWWHRLDVDRQWLAVLAAAILTSPLGWIHYAAWLLPLVVAAWRSLDSRWRFVALVAGSVPPVVVAAWPTLQLLYPASLLALYIACWSAQTATESNCVAAGQLQPLRDHRERR